DEAKNQPSERGFSTTRFANQSQGLSLPYCQIHAVHGADLVLSNTRDVFLLQTMHIDKRPVWLQCVHMLAPMGLLLAEHANGFRHVTSRPGAIGRRGTERISHSEVRYIQRGANRQPGRSAPG